MGVGAAVSAGVQLLGAAGQAAGEKSAGRVQEALFNANARFAEMEAENVKRRGGKEASRFATQAKQLIGVQRASLAAQGIDLSGEDAVLIQEQQKAAAQEDVRTIRQNARNEAFGLVDEAFQSRFAGRQARLGGDREASSTILSGGLSAFGTLSDHFGGK